MKPPPKLDPLRDILSQQERMNRLFEESLLRGRDLEPTRAAAWAPTVDVYETAEAFVMLVELPGVNEDDVEVTVEGDEVRLRGERHLPGPRPESFERVERSYGPFARSFRFEQEVDPDRVSAEFTDGLLRLEVRKAHVASARREREE
jgi:HSP20 family protein